MTKLRKIKAPYAYVLTLPLSYVKRVERMKSQHEMLCKRKRTFCTFTAVSSRKQQQITQYNTFTIHTFLILSPLICKQTRLPYKTHGQAWTLLPFAAVHSTCFARIVWQSNTYICNRKQWAYWYSCFFEWCISYLWLRSPTFELDVNVCRYDLLHSSSSYINLPKFIKKQRCNYKHEKCW